MVRCVVGADVLGGPRGRVRHGAVRCVVGADVPAARVAVFGMVRCVVGADVLGGPRARVRHGAVRGRGRRPRRPAWPCASSAASSWARRAEDVAPYHVFGMVRCVVGADVLGGPRGRVRHGAVRCVVGADVPAARVAVFGMVRCVVGADVLGGPRARVRHGAVRGRGRRPRRPAWPCASSAASSWARRAEDVAPYHVFGMVRCVRGRGRRPGGPRVRVRHGAVRGRGRRPRRPAWPWASSAVSLGRDKRVPPVCRFRKKRTKMLHGGRFGLAPSTVL